METSRSKDFFRLFMAYERGIYAYILLFVPCGTDADDIMQETATVMWERFDTFEPGTNFKSWAKKIALHKILDFRKKKKLVFFSDHMIEFIAAQEKLMPDLVDDRLKALQDCMQKLRPADRELIEMHYHQGITIKNIAERAKRSIAGLYKVMVRIHNQLLNCINRSLAEQGLI